VHASNGDATAPYNVNTYSIIAGNEAGFFAIDAATGEITVNGNIDRETAASFTLTVAVHDSGFESGNQDTATVTITVNDVEDNEAAFEQDDFTGSVAENSAVGTAVATVHASNGDATAPYNTNTYSIIAGNEAGLFAIDAATGAITVYGNIDRETAASFTLTVAVHDGGFASGNQDTATVTITVNDVEDNTLLSMSRLTHLLSLKTLMSVLLLLLSVPPTAMPLRRITSSLSPSHSPMVLVCLLFIPLLVS